MCNPRRVRVQATRKIAEAWRAEIEQAATAHGDVSSEARLVQSITDLLPPPARLAFEQAMRISADWVWADGEYRRTVPGGHAAYRPDAGELEIVIRLSVAIEAVATAKLVETGEVTGEVTADASGTYYGTSAATRESARIRAQAAADAKAEELAAQHKEALKQQAEEAARHALSQRSGEAAQEAKRTAERRLTLQAAELRPDLDQRASHQLEIVQSETLKGIFQLVAAGYSIALQAYAAEHGENLEVSEDDDVIHIQFEVER
jgi:hypothetical protein